MNPTPRLVYVAEPIDRAVKNRTGHADVTQLVNALITWGANIFRPSTAFRCQTLDARVDQINRHILYQADVLVAYLSLTVSSVGVPMEIEAATARGIPAIVLYGADSYALEANPLITVIHQPSEVIQAIEKALADRPDPTPLTLHDGLRVVVADGHEPPTRTYPDDAGVDLTNLEELVILPNDFRDVPTQVEAVQLPDGYWGMITGRSSTLRRWGLHVPQAVIDPGWRGKLYVGVWNLSDTTVIVPAGSRLGQLILIPLGVAPVVTVDQVEEHARGLAGFGSSGH